MVSSVPSSCRTFRYPVFNLLRGPVYPRDSVTTIGPQVLELIKPGEDEHLHDRIHRSEARQIESAVPSADLAFLGPNI